MDGESHEQGHDGVSGEQDNKIECEKRRRLEIFGDRFRQLPDAGGRKSATVLEVCGIDNCQSTASIEINGSNGEKQQLISFDGIVRKWPLHGAVAPPAQNGRVRGIE